MLLDHLLDQVSLDVQPFAVCDIRGGARMSLRSAPATLHFVVAGSGTLEAEGDASALEARMLVLTPPGLRHSLRAATESRLEALTLPRGPNLVHKVAGTGPSGLVLACGSLSATLGGASLLAGLRRCIIVDFAEETRVQALFDELLRELSEGHPGRSKMLEALMLQCLVHLLRRVVNAGAPHGAAPLWLRLSADARLSNAVSCMLDAPGAPHTLESLAATAGMSRSRFALHFRQSVGVPAMTFLRHVRLDHAKRLLLTTAAPIKALAQQVGFSSRSHFAKAFRQRFGVDPSALQQAGREAPRFSEPSIQR